MATIKVRIPKDHPAHAKLKVGDKVAMRGKVMGKDGDGADCEMDGCDKDTTPVSKPKTKISPREYLLGKR